MFWEHFRQSQNPGILPILQLDQYIDCQFRTKMASTFDEVSFESSEFRAFDRDLNEGAIIFPLIMRDEILDVL